MNAMELTGKDLIAYRTARLFKDGDVVNLGIGMPTKCLDYLPEGVDVWVDSENGVVGLTGAPKEGEYADPNVVDAGGKPSVLRVGGSCFDSFRSFGFIRGGHIDATVLGAYEVDAEGNLANWMIPGKTAAGMGGAMDLVTGSKVTIVMTTHCDKKGNPKIVEKTNMPSPAITASTTSFPSWLSSRSLPRALSCWKSLPVLPWTRLLPRPVLS